MTELVTPPPDAAAPPPAAAAPPPPTVPAEERRGDRWGTWLALLSAIILGIAAVLTAWSSYRESLTSDGVLKNYSEQQVLVSAANDEFAKADQQASTEKQFYVSYAIAVSEDNQGAQDGLLLTMSTELQNALQWWADQPDTGPDTPFVVENPHYATLPSQVLKAKGDALMAQAAERRAEAEVADAVSDRFGLANVFFAVVLFLAGIATLLSRKFIQVGVLALSVVMLGMGLYVLTTSPGWSDLT